MSETLRLPKASEMLGFLPIATFLSTILISFSSLNLPAQAQNYTESPIGLTSRDISQINNLCKYTQQDQVTNHLLKKVGSEWKKIELGSELNPKDVYIYVACVRAKGETINIRIGLPEEDRVKDAGGWDIRVPSKQKP